MATWFSDPTAAAWVQAGGSIAAVFVSVVTIIVAVWIPANQRSKSRADALNEQIRQDREQLRRLSAALRAEVDAAIDAIKYRETTAKATLELVEEAKRSGGGVVGNAPLRSGSMTLTDAIIYRQIAADVGRFPPELISSVVRFYTRVLESSRLAEGAPSALQACEVILGLASRSKMGGVMLLKTLEKFEAADFSTTADLKLSQDEIRKMAGTTGYPLKEVAAERGFKLE